MTYTFHLPDIGEGIAEAEVVRWLVLPGDDVVTDQPIAEVETDKAMVEMPAPTSGRVAELCAAEGDRVPVGARLIVIDDGLASEPEPGASGGSGTQPPSSDAPGQAQPEPSAPAVPASDPDQASGHQRGKRPMATPATRRLARELEVDLSTVNGTGPGGRISDDDVRLVAEGTTDPAAPTLPAQPTVGAATEAPATRTPAPSATGEDERIPVRGLRRRTAEAMVRALQEIPHTLAMHHADVDDLLALRKQVLPRAQAAGINLTLTPFLIKATALALRRYPMANASFDAAAQEIVVRGRRNIGFAVNTPDGLVIPVVKDADRKPVLQIAREVETLTEGARSRTVPIANLQEGTFTISNHGPLGGNFGTPIIRAPEGGILGFGRATPQAVVREGEIVARTQLPISYSADHRLVDGDVVIGFCHALIELLETPVHLLIEEA